MHTLTGYGQQLAQQAQRLPPLGVDAVLAAGCLVFALIMMVLSERTEWWIAAIATLTALPLLWRRRYPLTVTAVAGVGTTTLAIVGALGDFPAGQLLATYTFAAYCPPVRRLLGAVGTVAGITVSILVPQEPTIALGLAGLMFVVAYALGTGARARRDRIAMLEERARRLAEEQDATATRERERIAREMHDILAHSMSLVVVQAEAGPVVVRSDPGRAEEVFDTISVTAREALAQLRRALGVLRSDEPARAPPPGLDALPPLLAGVRRAGLAATLEQDGHPRPVPADLATTAYRIVQESLTNTVKHAAGASAVQVRLDWRDAALQLQVRDNGAGPAPGGPGPGRGLTGMRERVAATGGELSYGPGPDGVGFQVTACLPLPLSASGALQ